MKKKKKKKKKEENVSSQVLMSAFFLPFERCTQKMRLFVSENALHMAALLLLGYT